MTDIEQAFNDICDQLGCAYDNEAALFAIDKLQKSAQSDAEPVAWRYRYPNLSVWSLTQESEIADYALRDCIVEPLYAAPPRPDTSAEPRVTLDEIEAAMDRVLERRGLQTTPPNASAGLIEAVELPAAARGNEINFWYKNHRGETAIRFARILGLRWGTSEYHTDEQWLLRAYDYDRHAEREFAVRDMSPITADRARAADRSVND